MCGDIDELSSKVGVYNAMRRGFEGSRSHVAAMTEPHQSVIDFEDPETLVGVRVGKYFPPLGVYAGGEYDGTVSFLRRRINSTEGSPVETVAWGGCR